MELKIDWCQRQQGAFLKELNQIVFGFRLLGLLLHLWSWNAFREVREKCRAGKRQEKTSLKTICSGLGFALKGT